jgi:antitoxin HicB
MFYHFKIYKESKGYWAECIELEGCYTQADTLDELKTNMQDALNLFLSEPEKSNHIFPMPLKRIPKYKNTIVEKVHVNTSVAFSMLIRQTRIKKKLTLREMADILNYKNINTYVKLERAKTSNPQLKTLANIKEVFADFPVALIF